jgi:dihydrofolate reductase
VASFLAEGLVDEILHFVVPVVLNEGVPLYPSVHKVMNMKLLEAVAYPTGIVKLHYLPT